MPNFEADDTGGGYAKPTAGGTVLSGGSANTGNSLTRASVPAASYSPAGGAAAASSLQTYSSNSGSSGGNALVAASRSATPPVSLVPSSSSSGIVTTSRSGPSLVDISDPMTAARTAPSVTLPEAAPLRYGDGAHGENPQTVADVMNFQGWLLEKGFNPGKIDGWYGDNTMRAYRQYLRDKGIRSYAGAVTLPPVRAELAARQGLRSAGSPQVGAPLIPAPGQPLAEEYGPLGRTGFGPQRQETADLTKTMTPAELEKIYTEHPDLRPVPLPDKPLPGGVVPSGLQLDTPGEIRAFVQAHNAPPTTETVVAGRPDVPVGALPTAAVVPAQLTPEEFRLSKEGGFTQTGVEAAAEVARRDAQRAAVLPALGSAASPNKLVAATVPYGRGVDTIGLVPGGLPQGAPPTPQEVKVETAKTKAQPLTDAERTQVNAYKAGLSDAQVIEDEAMIKRLDIKDPDTFYKAAMDRDLAAGRVPAAAAETPAVKAEPSSLPKEEATPPKDIHPEQKILDNQQSWDKAAAKFDKTGKPVVYKDAYGNEQVMDAARRDPKNRPTAGGKQSSLDSRAAGQVASADAGYVPAGSPTDQEIAARGGTPTKPGPMGFEFGKIPPDPKTASAVEATVTQIASAWDNPYGGAVDSHGLPLQTKEEKRAFTMTPEDPQAKRYWLTRPESDQLNKALWWGPDRSPAHIKKDQEDMWQDLERPLPTHNQPMGERATPGGVKVASAGDDITGMATDAHAYEYKGPLTPAKEPAPDNYWFNPSSISGERGGAQPPAGYYTEPQILQLHQLFQDLGYGPNVDPAAATKQYIEHYKGNFKQNVPMSERKSDGGRRVGRNDVQEGQPYTAPDGSRRYKRSSGQQSRAA